MDQFPALKNDRLLKAARGEKVDKVPVWVMRQAGRYLPEFRELRSKHDFFKICQTPELACEVTLQPIERYPDLDASIIFSDILVIPQAMGMVVEMRQGVGPVLPEPLVTPEDMNKLKTPNVKEELHYVMEAITMTRKRLDGRVPLIGFSGAPWTLMGYMIEGGGSKTMSKSKAWLYRYPEQSKELLSNLAQIVSEYLIEQAKSGAQLLQVFESNAEYLGPELFFKFSLPFLKDISVKVKESLKKLGLDVPMTVFAKGAHYGLKELSTIGYDVIGIDWTVDPEVAREVTKSVTLQGNLDPCLLYAPVDFIEKSAREMVTKFGTARYIANLGHGIYPDVDPQHLEAFLKGVHSV